eukprot:TRINITY_DN9059_c0_g1_i2.p1 TRINITY_DN9059_c0_g1~~TRINITY_DN9059_c0_g1_i2.p1  ORF type:complete len:238 (-),score=12.87 TRINITY_DN9059_c0_g1_i2:72-689(-)
MAAHCEKYKEQHLKLMNDYVKDLEDERKRFQETMQTQQKQIWKLEAEIKRLQKQKAPIPKEPVPILDTQYQNDEDDDGKTYDDWIQDQVKIVLHPHALSPCTLQSSVCASCGDTISGSVYRCAWGCRFHMCNNCVLAAPLDELPSGLAKVGDLHPHFLQFQKGLVDRVCDVCFEAMEAGHTCPECTFDVCMSCLTQVYLGRNVES